MIILSDNVESKTFPAVNLLIIVSNVLVFLWMCVNVTNQQHFFYDYGTVPNRLIAHHDLLEFERLLSSMFIHIGFLHLLGNMWMLYLFGDNVEDRLGHFNYFLFYIACGLFADLGHIYTDPHSITPCIGASGAISGVMGAYLAMHPKASCKTWWGDDLIFFAFKTYEIPVSIVIGGWFIIQLISGFASTESGIAIFAHISGFVAGLLLLLCSNRHHADQTDGLKLREIALLIAAGSIAIYIAAHPPTSHAQAKQSSPAAVKSPVQQASRVSRPASSNNHRHKKNISAKHQHPES